jgi:hypothetical protein
LKYNHFEGLGERGLADGFLLPNFKILNSVDELLSPHFCRLQSVARVGILFDVPPLANLHQIKQFKAHKLDATGDQGVLGLVELVFVDNFRGDLGF